jgi:ribosomal protein S18 acetylase RimI-like enzyme
VIGPDSDEIRDPIFLTFGVTVRPATMADLQAIVAVHEAAFVGFFLTVLGRSFLRELYRAFVVDDSAICLVSETETLKGQTQVTGFVAGAVHPERFFRRLLFRRGLYFAVAAAPGLMRHPFKVLPRMLMAMWYRGERPSAIENAAVLSSLGVLPEAGRRGLGKALVEMFCEASARLGIGQVYLTTDHRSNEAANRFYAHVKFQLLTTNKRWDGRVMNTYLRVGESRADSER